MKRVMLFVVDALASRIVLPALERGELPNLAQLIECGALAPESIAIFPSITPAATASLATGCYPDQHGIAGAHWYDQQADEVAYYGDDFWVVLQRGFDKFFNDFLVRLNTDHLRANTAFEIVEQQGLSAACLNYLWFRGQYQHEVHTPWLLRLIPGVPSREPVPGPRTLCLGDFVADVDKDSASDGTPSARGGPFNRFGFEDAATAAHLLQLVKEGNLADFTLAYFPDNDFESHSAGPREALQVVKRFDDTLGALFDAYGGCDALLEDAAILITGDHSQSDIVDDESQAEIALEKVLQDYILAPAGESWGEDDELMVCPNMRAAQIYLRHRSAENRARLVEALLAEPRIDQVIWQEKAGAVPEFHVATADRGSLSFRRGAGGEDLAVDQYGRSWSLGGSLSAVGGALRDGELSCEEYPNALERIAGAFFDQSGDLWVTARAGHAFTVPETSVHPRGSHGSLHADDSLSPLVMAGAPAGVELPRHPRSVDVLPLCLEILGIADAISSTPRDRSRAAG